MLAKAACGRGLSHPRAKAVTNTPFDVFHDYEGTLNSLYYGDNLRLLYATTFALGVDSKLFEYGLRFNNSFHISAGEDIDLSLKAIRMGGYIFPVDNLLIYHDYNYNKYCIIKSFGHFLLRFKRYGIGNAKLIRFHPYYYNALKYSIPRRTIRYLSKNITKLYKKIILNHPLEKINISCSNSYTS